MEKGSVDYLVHIVRQDVKPDPKHLTSAVVWTDDLSDMDPVKTGFATGESMITVYYLTKSFVDKGMVLEWCCQMGVECKKRKT